MTKGDEEKIISKITGKKILYIATKNADYIRLTQEIDLLSQYSESVDTIVFATKSYVLRIQQVLLKTFLTDMRKYDLIFIGFMPQLVLPILKWKFPYKEIIIDFFISIYDTLVDDRKICKARSLIGKLTYWLDRKTLQNADSVLADTYAHKNYFSQEFRVPENKIFVLYLKADVSFYYPMKRCKEDGLKDKFNVVYFGSILPVQGVEIILETIKLMQNNDAIHFTIIGPIKKNVPRPNGENVTYINWLSQRELAIEISKADLCLGGHFSNTIGKANRTIPGKVYIYRAMGKPVVLGDSDANREQFQEQKNKIYFVKRGDAYLLKKCIENIAYCGEEDGY